MPQRSLFKVPEETGSAAPLIPPDASLEDLRNISKDCRACGLWENATQTVFGEGRTSARIVLVGEQPGDVEDIAGKPFIGPAGRLLDKCLEDAGIDRSKVYVTNVVKHFKWEARGKRRLHMKPNAAEVAACQPWLQAEIARVRPEVIVLLGATAAQALLGKGFKVTQVRGQVLEGGDLARYVMATVHPSSVLRASDDVSREHAREALTEDLRNIAHLFE